MKRIVDSRLLKLIPAGNPPPEVQILHPQLQDALRQMVAQRYCLACVEDTEMKPPFRWYLSRRPECSDSCGGRQDKCTDPEGTCRAVVDYSEPWPSFERQGDGSFARPAPYCLTPKMGFETGLMAAREQGWEVEYAIPVPRDKAHLRELAEQAPELANFKMSKQIELLLPEENDGS